MKYSEIRVFKYTIPIYSQSFSEREGLLLQTTFAGKELWSEVAPLPSWSKETLSEIISFLQNDLFFSLEMIATFPPSLQFGIESLQEQIKQETLRLQKAPMPKPVELQPSLEHATLEKSTPSAVLIDKPIGITSPESILQGEKVSLNGLLMGPLKSMEKRLSQILDNGYTTAKLKMQHLSEDEALGFIKEIKGSIKLRLDLNKSWNLDQALHFFSNFSDTDFEYIEEPLKNFSDLKHFPYPLALDESLREISIEDLQTLPNLKACVVKPTLHGRFASFEPIYQFCKENQKSMILSSSFESGVGLVQIARLSRKLSLPHCMGLDT
ncbi:MAG: hypothetical protein HKM07_08590, partial [Chlamydiae bacterium]|nr:hypothetical protein [Chlamydiota bacterium]